MIRDLIEKLREFRDGISRKPEDDRTKREELLIETATAFEDQLLKYQATSSGRTVAERPADQSVLSVMRSYNEINRDHDLMDADIELASAVRQAGRGRGSR